MTSDPRSLLSPRVTSHDVPLPPSVRIDLAGVSAAIESALGPRGIDTLSHRLSQLQARGADAALMTEVVRKLSTIAPRLVGPGGLDAWLTAVCEVDQSAPHCTGALLQSSEEVLRHGSPLEFLMWARLGLRRGQQASLSVDDDELAHFELRSRQSAALVSGDEAAVNFVNSRPRLRHLLRALYDVAPAIHPVEQGIATRRPFLSNLGLHLPESSRALRGPAARDWYDAAASHAAAHLRHSRHRFERGSLKPVQMALVGLLEDARVEALAVAEMPGLRRLWLRHHAANVEHGQTFQVLMLRLARGLLDPAYEDPHPWVTKGRRLWREFSAAGTSQERLAPATLRDMASRLGNDIGQRRLQFNYREYVVEPSYRDDNAHLWLDEQEASAKIVSTTDPLQLPTDATPKSPVPSAEMSPALVLARFQYAEWDRLVGDYRSAWCTVREIQSQPSDPSELRALVESHGPLLHQLKRALRAGRMRDRLTLRAQLRGDDLDVDAAVRSQIDRRLRHTPSEKVEQRQARSERSAAALLLIDSSTSTADLSPSGERVLDLARNAALLTVLTLTDAGDRCAIDTFCSNGRHEVEYLRAVEFGELLGQDALGRLAGVSSRWSTRMGAAIRHAGHRLEQQPQARRLLLFITDGEPHDIDIHDKRYLVEDARRAVLEVRRRGINVFCVTLDPAADDYLRKIFGSGHYRVLDRIESLPRVLPRVVVRLVQ